MNRSEVHLCRPDDPRLAKIWSQHGGFEQSDDDAVMVVIGRATSDTTCARLAARFGLEFAALRAFRDAGIVH